MHLIFSADKRLPDISDKCRYVIITAFNSQGIFFKFLEINLQKIFNLMYIYVGV